MKLIIEDDEGRKTVVPLVQEEMEITIGRQEDNAIRLTERNVSRKHARLTRKKSEVFIEDLGSYCGIKVNGQRIDGVTRIAAGDVFQIGDYDLGLQIDKVEERVSVAAKSAPDQAQPAFAKIPSQRLSTSIISIENAADYDNVPVVDIPSEEAPRLVILTGDLKGREFSCIRSVLTCGRDFENDIAIDHRSLSRSHCKFIRTLNGEWKVVDLGSSNGVQVNGETYSVGTLASGDTVTIGRVKLRFVSPEEEAAHGHGGKAGGRIAMIGGCVGLLLIGAVAGVFFARGSASNESMPQVVAPPPSVSEEAPVAQAQPVDAAPAPEPTPAAEPAAEPAPVPQVDEAALQAMSDGKALMAKGKYAEALPLLQKAAEAKIEGAEALVAEAAREEDAADTLKTAQDLFDEGQFDEALAQLESIPEKSALHGEAKSLREEIEAAVAEAEEEERREEERQAAARAKAEARKQAAAKKARHPYGSAYVEIPADKMEVLDGYLGEMCDNPGKAIGMLRRLIKENPNYGDAYMFLGSCYIATQETEKGEQQYKIFLKRWPKHPDAQMVRDSLGQ